MTMLTVNLDKVTALRALVRGEEPDPAQAAIIAELAGAEGISLRLRSDRKLVRERDLYMLREVVKGRFAVELPPADDLIEMIMAIKPAAVTLVADQPNPDTPAVGIDFRSGSLDYSDLVARLQAMGASVSFFVEPQPEAIKAVEKAGANGLQLDCSAYTTAGNPEAAQAGLDLIDRAAQAGARSKLSVAARRSINYRNLKPLVELRLFDEFVIGDAIAARAMLTGYSSAVESFKKLINPHPTNN